MTNQIDLANEICNAVKENAKVDSEFITSDVAFYNEVLPEGIEPEIADKVNAFNLTFMAGTAKATAELGVEGENNELSSSFTNGHQQFEHLYQKEVEIAGEKKQHYLTSSILYDLGDVDSAIGKVHADLAKLATE